MKVNFTETLYRITDTVFIFLKKSKPWSYDLLRLNLFYRDWQDFIYNNRLQASEHYNHMWHCCAAVAVSSPLRGLSIIFGSLLQGFTPTKPWVHYGAWGQPLMLVIRTGSKLVSVFIPEVLEKVKVMTLLRQLRLFDSKKTLSCMNHDVCWELFVCFYNVGVPQPLFLALKHYE